MAYRRRGYRRRYYYRRYKSVKYGGYNMLKIKAERNDLVKFPQGPAAGQPVFASINASYLSLNTFLANYAPWNNLKLMFSYYKILGAALEVIPVSLNTNGQIVITNNHPVYLTFAPSESVAIQLQQAEMDNNSLHLDPTMRQRKYVRLYGATGEYRMLSTETIGGGFTLNAFQTGTDTDSPQWTIKISVYVALKRSRL